MQELGNTTSEQIFDNDSIIEEEASLTFSIRRYDLREWVTTNVDGRTADGHDRGRSPTVNTRYFDFVLL